MLIKEELYYAPDIRFADLDLSGNLLPDQFKTRIHGYYLLPAAQACEAGHAFAAGALLVSCIDALARIRSGNKAVGPRFRNWCEQELPSFRGNQISIRFYDDFRNGLIHEARIKNGGEFTLESNSTVERKDHILSINPLCLLKEVSVALDRYVALLKQNGNERNSFLQKIVSDFAYELNH
jgi:hypothetical protein